MTLSVPSPLELKTSLRIGSKAAPSVALPIGNVATLLPESASTTTITLLAQVANRRRAFGSIARPRGLRQVGIGQCDSILLVLASILTISLLATPLMNRLPV